MNNFIFQVNDDVTTAIAKGFITVLNGVCLENCNSCGLDQYVSTTLTHAMMNSS